MACLPRDSAAPAPAVSSSYPADGRWRALGFWCLVRQLPAEERSAGGVCLPDAEASFFDAEVLSSGAEPASVREGDRVLGARDAFRYLRTGERGGRRAFEGFADLRLLLARIPGPEWERVEPLSGWTVIDQDRRTALDPETGVVVRKEQRGRIVVAEASLLGAAGREEREVERYARELDRLCRSPRFRAQPTLYDRVRMVHDYLDGVPKPLVPELKRRARGILERGESTWSKREVVYARDPERSGVLRACGPACGRDARDLTGRRVFWGERAEAYYVSGEAGGAALVRAADLVAVEERA